MKGFEKEYFQRFEFTRDQVERYFKNALRDLEIARKDSIPEVKFSYGYQALIKAGIALLAHVGQVRVRGIPGHHVKILGKMSEILRDDDLMMVGNAMRMKRNDDFYGGGTIVTEKEAVDYFRFVENVLRKAAKRIRRSGRAV
ncbi:MAG: hypothetical protein HY211_07800 [Candidatus Omnitrophica bacterium]|nr:hypothetical protein [Candidatus Omnitrophota bacterium]